MIGINYQHKNFHFIQEDITKSSFPDNFFDCAYAISVLEHIGIEERYAVNEKKPAGDIEAVSEIKRILRPKGNFLATVPFGKGRVFKPLHRIYDTQRLNILFSGWNVINKDFYTYTSNGLWEKVSEETAGHSDYLKGDRTLACLELRK